MNDVNKTIAFSTENLKKLSMKDKVSQVYDALEVKGYNATNQLIGYLLSEDPTYITSYNGARQLVTKIDRYELLAEMLEAYLNS